MYILFFFYFGLLWWGLTVSLTGLDLHVDHTGFNTQICLHLPVFTFNP